MKHLLLILLVLSVSCKDRSSDKTETIQESQSTTPPTKTPIVTPPVVVRPPVVKPPETPTPSPTWTEEFMELVNTHRQRIGLRALRHDEGVAGVARTHSQNMASGIVAFGHDGFSDRCKNSRTELGGGNWCGENVAMGQKTPADAFKSWMNSPGHRANIEQTRATHTGFGYAKSTSGKYYWTQIFVEL